MIWHHMWLSGWGPGLGFLVYFSLAYSGLFPMLKHPVCTCTIAAYSPQESRGATIDSNFVLGACLYVRKSNEIRVTAQN